jgi:hypothetical protein
MDYRLCCRTVQVQRRELRTARFSPELQKYSVFVILDKTLHQNQNSHDFVVHRQTTFDFWSKDEHQEASTRCGKRSLNDMRRRPLLQDMIFE